MQNRLELDIAVLDVLDGCKTYFIGDYNHTARITTLRLMCRDQEFNYLRETFHENFILFAVFLSEICCEKNAEEIFFRISFYSRRLHQRPNRGLALYKKLEYRPELRQVEKIPGI